MSDLLHDLLQVTDRYLTKSNFCVAMLQWMKPGSTILLLIQVVSQLNEQQAVKVDECTKSRLARLWPQYFGMPENIL